VNLSELIETHKGRRSYPELARDCGGVPSSKRLQQLVREPIKNFPDPPTVSALARGLRVPQRVVVLSAAESLGLEVSDTSPRVMQLMPAAASSLSEEQAAAVAHLVDVIVSDPLRAFGDGRVDVARAEPTVASVRAAQVENGQHLRAVAQDGDEDDQDRVDELARRARAEQTNEDA
jgi:hypothetical protein